MQAVKALVSVVILSITSSLIAAEEPAESAATAAGTNTTNAVAVSTNAAVTLAAGATNSPAETLTNEAVPLLMDVRIKVEGGPGQISASRAYITVGTNRFAFLVPGGFKVDNSDPQRITLVRPDSACIVSLRVIQPNSEQGLSATECREKIMKEHPGCMVDGEFSLAAGNSSGPAYEIRWKVQEVRRSARLAYVPFRAGVVEFCLDSSPEKFAAMQTFLNDIMMTFRASDPDGKIEATPLYNNI